jgi:hypothetical protein
LADTTALRDDNMTAETDAYAYLRITGPDSVDLITRQMGIEPDEGWSEGDPRRRGHGNYTGTSWALHSGAKKGLPLDTHIRALWRRVEPYGERLIQLGPEYSRYLVCTAGFPSKDSEFKIAAGHFSTAAYYRLEIDFDFYFLDNFGDGNMGNDYASW